MLQAANIHVTLGGAPILAGVSLTLHPGEVMAVLGPNGAGKSTLLQVLSGTRRPQAGEIALDGRAMDDWPRAGLARRRAVLSQKSLLSFPFTALEVVLLGRSPHAGHCQREEDLRIAEAAMRETAVLHLAGRSFPTLSGGEQQRVRLAQVFAQIWPDDEVTGTRILLLDEPTNNLDLAHQHAVLKLARQFADRGVAVAAILHDPNLAASVDRVCVLKTGRVLAKGTPDTELNEATIAAAFDLDVKVLRHPDHDRPYIIPS